ncbi:MAG TPA: hypothetical protein VFY84_21200 [Jiangellales bacterium]|nr:hypothetical protein [Jiangellales bacterium]
MAGGLPAGDELPDVVAPGLGLDPAVAAGRGLGGVARRVAAGGDAGAVTCVEADGACGVATVEGVDVVACGVGRVQDRDAASRDRSAASAVASDVADVAGQVTTLPAVKDTNPTSTKTSSASATGRRFAHRPPSMTASVRRCLLRYGSERRCLPPPPPAMALSLPSIASG